jgi:hypothetical protein
MVAKPIAFVYLEFATCHKPNRRILFEVRKLKLNLVWQPTIIAVEQGDQVAFTLAYAGVACSARSTVLSSHIAHTLTGVTCDHLSSIVGRAVINYDDFVGQTGLGEHAIDRGGEG